MEQATILMRFRMSMAAILMITVCPWTVVHAQIPVPTSHYHQADGRQG